MIPIFIIIVLIVCLVLAMYSTEKNASDIHSTLDKFMEEAKSTYDVAKLRELNKRLIDYAKKKCWHRHFGAHAKEINIYICAKLDGMAVRDDLRN